MDVEIIRIRAVLSSAGLDWTGTELGNKTRLRAQNYFSQNKAFPITTRVSEQLAKMKGSIDTCQ